jgi:hypothetical protein
MISTKHILATSMAILMASASSALAGTKIQGNIVPATTSTTDTLSTKGKLQIKDTGSVQVSLKGVLQGGALVAETAPYDPADPNSVDPSHYVTIVKISVAALPLDVEVVTPVALKKGNGTTKLDLAGMVALLDALGTSVLRSFEGRGGEVWGPLSAADPNDFADCKYALTHSTPFAPPPMPPIPAGVTLGDDPVCRLGTKIGVVGINIPVTP